MAQSISLTSGTILNGSPITLRVQPYAIPTGTSTPSYHRIILEIECAMTGGNYDTIKMSTPVLTEDATPIIIDISSALRTLRDTYRYTHQATTYPVVKFNVSAYDEYMIDGIVTQTSPIYYPQNPWQTTTVNSQEYITRNDASYLRTIFGALTDMERLTATASQTVQTLTRKPTTLPQIVAVGETYAHTPSYTSPQALFGNNTLTGPTSQIATISTPGIQTIGTYTLCALPASKKADRQLFRFINGYGVLESISIPRTYKKQASVSTQSHIIALPETLNTFSRTIVRKHSNREKWQFSTDPLDELWVSWYMHEFLMAQYIWMQIGDTWVPCTITPEDETTLRDDTERTMYTLTFTVQPDINGSPIL